MNAGRTVTELHIAPTAEVDDGVQLGAGSRIWGTAQVRSGARVGTECIIGRGACIDAGVIVGNRCKIQSHALIYSPAVLEDGVFIGPAVVLTNDRYPRAIDANGSIKEASDWEASGVIVEMGASIGARAVVVAGVRIGRWAMVAAGAVVTSDVPSYGLAMGVPARRVGWVDEDGLPLERIAEGRWRSTGSGACYREHSGELEVDS